MGAAQIAEIRPAIAELESLAPDERANVVARFGVPDEDALWVEVILGTVNLAYPFGDEPSSRLKSAGVEALGSMVLVQWEQNVYATFEYRHESDLQTARFIDQVFEKLLGAPAGYAVNVVVERL